jgi:hypothetical protein
MLRRIPSWQSTASSDPVDRSLSRSVKSHTISQFIEEQAQRKVDAEERIAEEERLKQRKPSNGQNVTFQSAGMLFLPGALFRSAFSYDWQTHTDHVFFFWRCRAPTALVQISSF